MSRFAPGSRVELASPNHYHTNGIIDDWIDLQGQPDPVTGEAFPGLWSATFQCADGTIENLWLLERDLVGKKPATRHRIPFHRLRFESPYALSGTSKVRRAYALYTKIGGYHGKALYLTVTEFIRANGAVRAETGGRACLTRDTRVIVRLKGKSHD